MRLSPLAIAKLMIGALLSSVAVATYLLDASDVPESWDQAPEIGLGVLGTSRDTRTPLHLDLALRHDDAILGTVTTQSLSGNVAVWLPNHAIVLSELAYLKATGQLIPDSDASFFLDCGDTPKKARVTPGGTMYIFPMCTSSQGLNEGTSGFAFRIPELHEGRETVPVSRRLGFGRRLYSFIVYRLSRAGFEIYPGLSGQGAPEVANPVTLSVTTGTYNRRLSDVSPESDSTSSRHREWAHVLEPVHVVEVTDDRVRDTVTVVKGLMGVGIGVLIGMIGSTPGLRRQDDVAPPRRITASEAALAAIANRVLTDPRIEEEMGLGSSSELRVAGRRFAQLVRGELVLKLPAGRCDELVSAGVARSYLFAGRPLKQWVVVGSAEAAQWPDLLEQSLAFVGGDTERGDGSR